MTSKYKCASPLPAQQVSEAIAIKVKSLQSEFKFSGYSFKTVQVNESELSILRMRWVCKDSESSCYAEVLQDVMYGYKTAITSYEVVYGGDSFTVFDSCDAVSEFLHLLESDKIDYVALVSE